MQTILLIAVLILLIIDVALTVWGNEQRRDIDRRLNAIEMSILSVVVDGKDTVRKDIKGVLLAIAEQNVRSDEEHREIIDLIGSQESGDAVTDLSRHRRT